MSQFSIPPIRLHSYGSSATIKNPHTVPCRRQYAGCHVSAAVHDAAAAVAPLPGASREPGRLLAVRSCTGTVPSAASAGACRQRAPKPNPISGLPVPQSGALHLYIFKIFCGLSLNYILTVSDLNLTDDINLTNMIRQCVILGSMEIDTNPFIHSTPSCLTKKKGLELGRDVCGW